MPTLYLETTIPSYLTARPTSDVAAAAKQSATREWWSTRRNDFDLFVSEVVLAEAALGHPEAAARRLAVLAGLPKLEANESVELITESVAKLLALPTKALADAAHIALCIVHRIDYLLTWNCTHIANATHRRTLERLCDELELLCPVICTPEELY